MAPSARSRSWRRTLRRGLPASSSADSIALDFHKWAQVPYDAGFILVRDGTLHRDTFASPAAYLRRETRGLAAGKSWPCDFGPDLSRGFRALKTWFTLKVYGTDALGAMISRTCELARYLEIKIADRAASWNCSRRSRSTSSASAIAATMPIASMRRSSRICRNPASPRRPRPIDRQSARDPRGDRQSPHRAARYRCPAGSGNEIRRGVGNKLCRLSQGRRACFPPPSIWLQTSVRPRRWDCRRSARWRSTVSIWRRCGTRWFTVCKRGRTMPPRCSTFRPSRSCKPARRIASNCNWPR